MILSRLLGPGPQSPATGHKLPDPSPSPLTARLLAALVLHTDATGDRGMYAQINSVDPLSRLWERYRRERGSGRKDAGRAPPIPRCICRCRTGAPLGHGERALRQGPGGAVPRRGRVSNRGNLSTCPAALLYSEGCLKWPGRCGCVRPGCGERGRTWDTENRGGFGRGRGVDGGTPLRHARGGAG